MKMYRVFFYRVDDDGVGLYIEDEKEFETFNQALSVVRFFEDDDLFEITRDVFDNGVTALETVARPASMNAYINSYFSRW